MTLRVFLGSLVCGVSALFLAGSLAGPQSPSPTDRTDMWKQVDDAISKGLPKTAAEQLETIYQAALKDKAYPEATKAIAYKIVLEGQVQGGDPSERIKQLQPIIESSPAEMKPMLHALQGSWYWSYFLQNRWQFANRTATTSAPSDDFTTWDLKRLFEEIDLQYSLALKDEATLKATPIANLDALLEKGNVPDSYRPTAFDFLAHHALAFYSAGEHAGTLRQDAFEIDASSPALGTLDEFLAWKPETKDEQSTKLRAIQLFQNLLNFHRDDADSSPLLDADLQRLQFAFNMSVGEEKADRYKSALKQLADQNAKHELSALARARWAQLLVQEQENVEALEVAQQGANAFPQSPGGIECKNLIADIRQPLVSLQTERVWSEPLPSIRVTYRNVNRLHFRVVRVDWMGRLTQDRWQPGQFNDADRKELANRPRAAEWTTDLPATDDYRPTTYDVPAPKGLPAGYYIVIASMKPDFSETDNQVFACEAWVSHLALVVRQSWSRPMPLSGFILDNRTGLPIAGAKIQTLHRDRQNRRFIEGPSTTSDADGQFSLESVNNASFIVARHNDEVLATMNEYASQQYREDARAMSHVNLFTDRSLYRPGQMIHFKGVAMLVDQKENRYELMKNRNFRVKLLDINQQQVAQLEVKSNDFGSFSGSFTAPRDRGTGNMVIVVDEMNFAQTSIQVEEYKRPKFQVDLDAPKDPSRLGEAVKVTGKAMSYTGAPIQGASVRYRVVRQVRWPDWFMVCYGWRIAPFLGQSQEIANGWTETRDDGAFECQFIARPDRSVPESDDPIFTYSVTVDVTDGTGETRSDQASVSVGYKTMQLEISADDWQSQDEKVKVRLRTTTLDGETVTGQGKLRVYSLREPEGVVRPDLLGQRLPRPMRGDSRRGLTRGILPMPEPDPADWKNWPLGDEVLTLDFDTQDAGWQDIDVDLNRGLYRCIAESQDRFGKPIKAELNVRVLDKAAEQLGLKVPFVFGVPRNQVEPGSTWQGLWGSGYEGARAYVEIEHRGKTLKKYWTPVGVSQLVIEQPIEEVHRGGLTVHVTMVRENRLYTETRLIDVPWSQKQLQVRWDRFRSKLTPGSEETWSVTITDPSGKGTIAEMVAALYDQSLDAYLPHNWLHRFSMFYQESSSLNSSFQNVANGFQWLRGNIRSDRLPVSRSYRQFPSLLQAFQHSQLRMRGLSRFGSAPGIAGEPMVLEAMAEAEGAVFSKSARSPGAPMAAMADALAAGAVPAGMGGGGPGPNVGGPKLDSVSPRKNLNETAFFFPHMISDETGKVTIQFAMPEALTQWRFLSFAHDEQLRSGSLFDSVVTTKDLMVQPNPPRFLREGDELEFSVKLTNQSPSPQTGTVALHLSDAIDLRNLDEAYDNKTAERPFELAPNSSKSLRWKIRVPDGARPIIFKAVAATEKLSDGEEGMLPVLSNQILVTESLPLPIRGPAEKEFEFKKLLESGQSKTLRHQSLTIQMTSQPAWYAVLALPYLMEYPHECSEQVFNRLYANALAKHVATSDPKIERVFAVWRELQPEALQSPLSKNEDLKSVMIEETPWLRNAEKESQARKNVGMLFERNRLDAELQRAMTKLAQMQRENGMWPWFPGGPDNEYLSLYIVTGFGRLRHMGVGVDESLAIRALDRLDAWMQESFERIPAKERNAERNHLSPTIAMYMYGRSFYLVDRPIAEPYQSGLRFWQEQARAHWLKLSRQSQAHIAIGMKRMGDRELPNAIMKSLKENSISDEEMGMHWRDNERSWWWYHAPIETQAILIEAFDEVAGDPAAVEDCKVWLLKQKQTQDWKTTKATADAVYALLGRGANWLASDSLVQVKVGDLVVEPDQVEAGTGFYERTYPASEVRPDMGKVRVTKSDTGVSWGSIHWQYLEDIRNVTSHVATPLSLEKKIYRRQLTESGPVLEEVLGPISVGDELVCRIVLKTDRDMEYVHLKDYRGSGTEPVNVLSGYRYQDGLAYYESTRDTATHFFIDYLRRGTYVFEYTLRVQHAGDYPMGLATLQCMYAPEFNSHSESVQLQVK
jgi:hypothetical protein